MKEKFAIFFGLAAFIICFLPGFAMTRGWLQFPDYELLSLTVLFVFSAGIPALLYAWLSSENSFHAVIPVLVISTVFAVSSTVCNWIYFRVLDVKAPQGLEIANHGSIIYAPPMLAAIFISAVILGIILRIAFRLYK